MCGIFPYCAKYMSTTTKPILSIEKALKPDLILFMTVYHMTIEVILSV